MKKLPLTPMFAMKKITLVPLAAVFSLALSGCAYDFNGLKINAPETSVEANKALLQLQRTQNEAQAPVLSETSDNRLRTRSIERTVDSGDVSISVAGLPLSTVLNGIAKAQYYTVLYLDDVQTKRPVTIDLQDVSGEAAIRRVAMAAGYAAAIDRGSRTVTLSERASYTFRLPPHLLSKLEAKYTVGGNPVSTASGTGRITGGSTNNIKADFSIDGGMKSDGKALADLVTSMAGPNSEVKVAPEVGMITVKSNAQALYRVHQFLNRFANDAQRRVEIEASIVEVALTDEFQYGLDWTRLFGSGSFRVLGTSAVTTPSVTAAYTKNSIAATINLLRTRADVRVIASPRIMAMNRSPSSLFDGKQIPYVDSIVTTVTGGTSGTTQRSGTASYVSDGISLSLTADVMNDREVQLTLVPVLASVERFDTFQVGGDQLTAPVQVNKQSLMQVISETGRTVVLGGIKYSGGNKTRSGLPGIFDVPFIGKALSANYVEKEINREVVILLRSNIFIPAPFDCLFSESI